MTRYAVPLLVFLLLVAVLYVGLHRDPREVPSPLIDKPAPMFALPRLDDPATRRSIEEMRGKVWLLNVWASWCAACRDEHPLLVDLAKSGTVRIYGLDYKDQREDALDWLRRFGNPYADALSDSDGRVGMDYGVYGVPETFVIDKAGVIRYKQIGPVTPEILRDKILPLVKKLDA